MYEAFSLTLQPLFLREQAALLFLDSSQAVLSLFLPPRRLTQHLLGLNGEFASSTRKTTISIHPSVKEAVRVTVFFCFKTCK